MQNFENDNILSEIKALKDSLEFANEKFQHIQLDLNKSAQSLDELLKLQNQESQGNLNYQNIANLQERKRINDNLLQQLRSLHEHFFNLQNGIVWFSMQVAVYHSLLQQAAFYVSSEKQVLEAKKQREAELVEKETLRHRKVEPGPQPFGTTEASSAEEMAQKARTFPFHLNPYRTWPF